MGKLSAWQAADRAQSFSKALWLHRVCVGCISTKRPHCLSNCLTQSKHNLLSTSLQLKYIKLVGGYLHSFYVTQYEALGDNTAVFAFLAPKHRLDFLFAQKRVSAASFLPDAGTRLCRCFRPAAAKGTAQRQREQTKAPGAHTRYTSSETAHPSRGKRVRSRRLGSKASPSRVYSPVRSIYISKFVLVSKHGCPWLLNVAALCKRALGTLRRG